MAGGPVALILADVGDPVAWSVAAVLSTSSRLRPLVVDTSGLSSARFCLRLSADGHPTSVVQMAQCPMGDDPAVLWCRGRTLPMPGFAHADQRDRDYAAAEMRALVVGWLSSLGDRLVNSVDGDGLVGPSWTPTRWLVEGARCGLRASSVTMATSGRSVAGWRGTPYEARRPVERTGGSGTDSVVVAGRRVVGGLAPLLGESCVALADRAGCRLLGVSFVRQGGEWLMTSADPAPVLRTPLEVRAAAELLAVVAAGQWTPPVA